MMNILYDISILGSGQLRPYERAGIFRVVEEVAFGLAESTECQLEFSAFYSNEILHAAQQYLQGQDRLRHISLPAPPIHPVIGRALHQVADRTVCTFGEGNFCARNAKRVANKVCSILWRTYPTVAPRSLAKAEIFHSPFHAFHLQVNSNHSFTRFLTVYDLIPIKFPQFYGESGPNMQALMAANIASVQPADWVLCISEATKNDLCEYAPHLNPDRVVVTHLAASELFHPISDPAALAAVRQKYHLPDAPYILSVSTLEPRKNIDHVIRAFVRLITQEHLDDLYLVLTGSKGWNYERIFSEITGNPAIIDKIILTGYVADDDLPALYSGALAFAYLSHYEGFGLPPLEAMQCGTPVIASNTSSLPEVVGDAGIMLAPTDLEGLCQAMLRLYANVDLRANLRAKAMERAGHFSWKRCVDETMAAYKLALAERGK